MLDKNEGDVGTKRHWSVDQPKLERSWKCRSLHEAWRSITPIMHAQVRYHPLDNDSLLQLRLSNGSHQGTSSQSRFQKRISSSHCFNSSICKRWWLIYMFDWGICHGVWKFECKVQIWHPKAFLQTWKDQCWSRSEEIERNIEVTKGFGWRECGATR